MKKLSQRLQTMLSVRHGRHQLNRIRVCLLVAGLFASGCLRPSTHVSPVSSSDNHHRPGPSDISAFSADPIPESPFGHHFDNFIIKQADLETVLNDYYAISREHWEHGYSHVLDGRRTGILILKDGIDIKWMVKPGGLATLEFRDGTVTYLARELTPWKGEVELGAPPDVGKPATEHPR